MDKTLTLCLFFLASSILVLSMNSCSLSYGMGNTAEATRYQPRPVYRGKDTTANYFSGYISHNNGYGYFPDEDIMFGGARFHRAHTFKNYNLAYSGFGYAGSYDVQLIKDRQGEKSFYGGGLSAEANLNIPLFDIFDWRILGLRVSAWGEGGEFAKFRREIQGQEVEGTDGYVTFSDEAPNNFLTNISLNSELIYKNKNFDLGLNATYGYSFDPLSDNNVILLNIGMGAHFSRGRYTIFGNYNFSDYQMVFINYNQPVIHYSIGFSYQI